MPQIIVGSDTNPGGRKYNEDRCGVQLITTKSGAQLAAAVVCDGVGGEERGERAAQLAVDTFLDYLRHSVSADTLRLLGNGVKEANFAAFSEASRLGERERMACTLVAAVIENGETLFVANAGDSRAYLCRDGQLILLTRDHIFANVMVWMGKMSAEAAANNPDANRVMRVLGIKENIQVDVGFYDQTTDYGQANRVGRQGLKLQPGDSVLLCTDGLIKPTATTGRPLVNDDEIVRVLQTQEGDKAARAIMSIALGRIPVGEQVDNITVTLLQTEDPTRAVNQAAFQRRQAELQQREQRRKMALIAAAVAVPLGLLLVATVAAFAGFFAFVNANTAATATELAFASAVAMGQTQTVEAYTPTPSPTFTPVPTQVPTLAPGEIAKLYKGETVLEILVDDKKLINSPPDETRFIAVNHRGQGANGDIYLEGRTQLQFNSVTDPKIQLRILTGSDIFVQTGPYQNGADIELAGSAIVLTVRGCLAAYYADDNTLTADCFSGVCGFSTNFGAQSTPFNKGQQIKMNVSQPGSVTPASIPTADFTKYWQLLSQTSAGREDIVQCGVPNIVATQAAQATFRAAATATAQAAAQAATATAVVCEQLKSLGTPCR